MALPRATVVFLSVVSNCTSREASATGRGFSNTALTMVKIAVLAPMPRASVKTATTVKPGFFASILIPYRKSWSKVVILRLVTSGCEQGKRLKCEG